MGLLFSFFWGIFKKLAFFALVFFAVVFIWNYYKNKREARTFITKFANVEGLSKGAPVYSKGIEMGKVIKIFPIGNSHDIAVKALITNEDFPSPRGAVTARLVTNFKSGGGKALELVNAVGTYHEKIGFRQDEYMSTNRRFKKAINAPTTKVVLRIMRDTYQMSKDFAIAMYKALTSQESKDYQRHLEASLDNTITSLEYGTVKQDIKRGIEHLNDEIMSFEQKPNKEAMIERMIRNNAHALRNTLDSYANLSNTYKD